MNRLFKTNKVTFFLTRDNPIQLFKQFVRPHFSFIELQHAKKILSDNLLHSIVTQEFEVDKARKKPKKIDLTTEVFNLSCSPKLRNSVFVKHLRKSLGQEGDIKYKTKPPHPIQDKALAKDSQNDLPAFALHLRTLFDLERTYPLETANQISEFKAWYQYQALQRTPCYWTPALEFFETPISFAKQNDINELIDFFEQRKEFIDLPANIKLAMVHKEQNLGPPGFAVLLALLVRHPETLIPQNDLWRNQKIARWYKTTLLPANPNFQSIGPKEIRPTSKSVDLIGIDTGTSGLAQNLKMFSTTFQDLNLTFRRRDLERSYSGQTIKVKTKRRIKRSFALHSLNADRIPLSLTTPNFYHRNDVHHIGFCLWETSKIPKIHQLGIEILDEIWAPSRFTETLYADQSQTPVHFVGKGIPQLDLLYKLSKNAVSSKDCFNFFSAFDFHSSIERKNPIATLKAFQYHFPERIFPNVRLTFKSTKSVKDHWGDPNNQRKELLKAAIFDRRISYIEDNWSSEKLFQTLAQADCVISSHRGEGFGYFQAYALATATPLISTNWGGTKDFCNEETAYPVNCTLSEIPHNHSIHNAEGAKWADIDLYDLGRAMKEVYENPSQAKIRALTGQDFINQNYSMQQFKDTIKNRLSELNLI